MKGIQIVRNFHCSLYRMSSRPPPEVDTVIRVDHAGELGADRIYAGQMAILGHTKAGPTIQHMWDQEKEHKAKFEELIRKYRVRPTALLPIWNVAGYLLGAGTALMGEKAAMACTVAVESVIVEHYNDQLRTLMSESDTNKELLDTIQKFRDDEQEHHDCGLEHGAEQAPFYSALTQVIKLGCKTAIAMSKVPTFASHHRHYSTQTRLVGKDKWDLVTAVCLERKPKITKPLTELEEEYLKSLHEIEYENSHKSDHEIRHEKDVRHAAMLKKNLSNNMDEDDEREDKKILTAQDFEDMSLDEYNKFKPADKITDADLKSDKKSVNRALDSHLIFFVNSQLGDDKLWLLPHTNWIEGETLRQSAERCLKNSCGENIQSIVLGNAPIGFYKYKYPKTVNSPSVGSKVFFYKALYISGDINTDTCDYQWLTRKEMDDVIKNEKYLKSLKMFLFDED